MLFRSEIDHGAAVVIRAKHERAADRVTQLRLNGENALPESQAVVAVVVLRFIEARSGPTPVPAGGDRTYIEEAAELDGVTEAWNK